MKKNNRPPANHANDASSQSQPCHYAIRIKGILDPHWDWIENMTVTYIEPGETMLSGPIQDQAALHGLLARIRDLNLTLLSINPIDRDN